MGAPVGESLAEIFLRQQIFLRGDAVQHDLLAVAEIVYDDGGLTRLDQLDDGMGAYEAGSAGDKNGHGIGSFRW